MNPTAQAASLSQKPPAPTRKPPAPPTRRRPKRTVLGQLWAMVCAFFASVGSKLSWIAPYLHRYLNWLIPPFKAFCATLSALQSLLWFMFGLISFGINILSVPSLVFLCVLVCAIYGIIEYHRTQEAEAAKTKLDEEQSAQIKALGAQINALKASGDLSQLVTIVFQLNDKVQQQNTQLMQQNTQLMQLQKRIQSLEDNSSPEASPILQPSKGFFPLAGSGSVHRSSSPVSEMHHEASIVNGSEVSSSSGPQPLATAPNDTFSL